MTPIEEAIVEKLRVSGPCCLDEVVTHLSNASWGEVFAAVDQMSRDGRLLLSHLGYSTYQIALRSEFVSRVQAPVVRKDNDSPERSAAIEASG